MVVTRCCRLFIRKGTKFFSKADALTLGRFGCGVLFCKVLAGGHTRWAFVVFSVGALSDFFDGVVARRCGSSKIGPALDPTVDRIFTVCVLSAMGTSGLISWWLMGLFVFREGVVAWICVRASYKIRVLVRPSLIGKLHGWTLGLWVSAVLLEKGWGFSTKPVRWLLLALLTGLVSVFRYRRLFLHKRAGHR